MEAPLLPEVGSQGHLFDGGQHKALIGLFVGCLGVALRRAEAQVEVRDTKAKGHRLGLDHGHMHLVGSRCDQGAAIIRYHHGILGGQRVQRHRGVAVGFKVCITLAPVFQCGDVAVADATGEGWQQSQCYQ